MALTPAELERERVRQRVDVMRRALKGALKGLPEAVTQRDIADLSGDARRRAILSREIAEILSRLKTEDVETALGRPLGDAYSEGFRRTDEGAPVGSQSVSADASIDRDKLRALARNFTQPLGDAFGKMKSPLPYIAPRLSDLGKEKLLEVAISATARGLTWNQFAKEIGKALPEAQRFIQNEATRGMSIELDGGYRMNAERYANMLARTTSVQAANRGTLDRAEESGVQTVKVNVAPGSTDFCLELEGKIYALTDEAAQKFAVPLLADCPSGGPPFHPNCRHSISPFTPRRADIGKLPVADPAMLTRDKGRGAAGEAQKSFEKTVTESPLRYAKQIAESAARRGFADVRGKTPRDLVGTEIPGLQPGQKLQFGKRELSEDYHLAKRLKQGDVSSRADYRQRIADTLRAGARSGEFIHAGDDKLLHYHDAKSGWVAMVDASTSNVITSFKLTEESWDQYKDRKK